jgi:hypothetical protein
MTRLAPGRAGNALLYQTVGVIRIDQTPLGVLDSFAQFGIGHALFPGKPDKPLANAVSDPATRLFYHLDVPLILECKYITTSDKL